MPIAQQNLMQPSNQTETQNKFGLSSLPYGGVGNNNGTSTLSPQGNVLPAFMNTQNLSAANSVPNGGSPAFAQSTQQNNSNPQMLQQNGFNGVPIATSFNSSTPSTGTSTATSTPASSPITLPKSTPLPSLGSSTPTTQSITLPNTLNTSGPTFIRPQSSAGSAPTSSSTNTVATPFSAPAPPTEPYGIYGTGSAEGNAINANGTGSQTPLKQNIFNYMATNPTSNNNSNMINGTLPAPRVAVSEGSSVSLPPLKPTSATSFAPILTSTIPSPVPVVGSVGPPGPSSTQVPGPNPNGPPPSPSLTGNGVGNFVGQIGNIATNNPVVKTVEKTIPFLGPIFSDENLKTDVKPGEKSLDNFIKSVGSYQYEYKNPEIDGQGTFFGPMAQELEKSDVGKSAVINTPRGKMVDTRRLTLVNTSAISLVHRENERLQKQVDELRKSFSLIKGKK